MEIESNKTPLLQKETYVLSDILSGKLMATYKNSFWVFSAKDLLKIQKGSF